MFTKIKIGLLVPAVILTCLTLAACSSDNLEQQSGSTKPYTVWFTDPSEYRTNVLSVAQAETPFALVLPSYLPESINPTPNLSGRARTEFDVKKPVTIIYKRQRNDDDLVRIEERNSSIKTVPSNEDTYLTYLDTQVLESESISGTFTSDGRTIVPVPVLTYVWNRNDLNFRVTVQEYERSEARKIIESMIK